MLRPVRIRHYLAVMQAKGFAADQVLAGTGIDSRRLQDPNYLIDARQCRKVIGNMIELSGDPGIGFETGHNAEPADLGIVGYAIMSCRTMRQTLQLWRQYSSSLVGIMSKLELEEETDDGLTVSVVEPTDIDAIYIFCVEEILVMMYKIGGILAGGEPVVRRLEFTYPAPAHRRRYDEQFGCPIRFGAERSSAVVAHQWLDAPLRTTDEEFNKICLQHCGQILQQIESSGPISGRLRDIFLRSPRTLPKLDAAAHQFGMSPRSLRRHLSEEGASYQKLVDEFRADLACEYLRSTRMSTKEVAYLLGFKDHSAFRRSFKLWTGKTAREYRQQILQVG
ncbi:MAG: AraC family transcriptional regulator [Hydrocarboniphaga sp.]|uniref:AraC family transcriptional regulator n=1 Tax=Hydrocarboniphaga sp. TaxID=2033016 RepID=UPI002639B7BD|nr:AraC family transcriptional regulator [Hydrocarboniphaga sp.]MDB5968344.1 AraC family transcriptional regulator [Hydrocarboniphaga sp.]